jgi:SAM-dependent methyltransferase
MSSHHDPLGVPSHWVRRFAHLVPSGSPVLDIAAGGGRHARFFAGRNHPVVAVDRSLDGMADLSRDTRITLVQCDLEADPWPCPGANFGGVIVTRYLHRPLLPYLATSLRADGILIYKTFAEGNEAFGRPSDPRFLLRPNELLDAYREKLTVVAYEHGVSYNPHPAAVQCFAGVVTTRPVPL